MLKWSVTGLNRFQEHHRSLVNRRPPPQFTRGSDPLMQTARGKLQTKRSKLNDQINRQLRLRAGAENLYKATTNKSLRETVAAELGGVNASLQALKEDLADLNSAVHIYQHEQSNLCVPMLPLGLKETKEIDFQAAMKPLMTSHYKADPNDFIEEIQQLTDLRQACRTPLRSEAGIELLQQYYNQLYYIEKRFFSNSLPTTIFFEWYDSLTGVPAAQHTVGFEKGSVLFNMAALYSQLAARQDRSSVEGVDAAVVYFEKAAGAFRYLAENFSNPPSMDMQEATLAALERLMLAQAQESVFEKLLIRGVPHEMREQIALAKEASAVAGQYALAAGLLQGAQVRDYVPPSWTALAQVKQNYFSAVSHHITAVSFTEMPGYLDPAVMRTAFKQLNINPETPTTSNGKYVPMTGDERRAFAKSHLRQSVLSLEEAIRLHHQSKQLRRIDHFLEILRHALNKSMEKFASLEEEDDFTELQAAPQITSSTQQEVFCDQPGFDCTTVDDIFHNLGPLSVFCAKHALGRPRTVEMTRSDSGDYGFSVRGGSPVQIAVVEQGGLAQRGGIKAGDYLINVGDSEVKWKSRDHVVSLIRTSANCLKLTVITVDKHPPVCAQKTVIDTTKKSDVPETNNNTIDKVDCERESKRGLSWTLRRRRHSSKDSRKGSTKSKDSKNSVKHTHSTSSVS